MAIPNVDPIIVAPTPNPLRPDDSIDHDALARNVQRWLQTPLSGFVVGSAGGEENFLGDAERVAAVKTVAEAHEGQKFVIGGIDNPSTTNTLRLAESMCAAGADLVRVRIPVGGDVVAYYREVVEKSPIPVIVIHQTFNRRPYAATPEQIGDVCSMDNVFGYITEANMRLESRTRQFVPANKKFWICNGSILLHGALIGANGACMFFGNWAPHLVKEIMTLGMAGKFEEARKIQNRILDADYIGMTYGVAALKAGLNLLGYEGTRPRMPNPPLTESQTERLAAAFRKAGILD